MPRCECLWLWRANSHHVGDGSRKQAFVSKDRPGSSVFFLENRLGVGITSKISKVEKKSNLDVLDKRGWNVVIYAIETQMLTDAGSWDLILAIPCCPRHHGCHAVVDAQKQRSIRCWWSWARMQPSFCELETRRKFEIQTLRAWVLETCFMTC